jgi:splicing factor 3A subunit 3
VATLKSQYDEEDSRKAEIDALTAPALQSDLSEFYARLVKVQDHYNKYPDVAAGAFESELAALLEGGNQDGIDDEYEEEDPVSLMFSGEEAYGKYVDLYVNHTTYNNLKSIAKRLPYLQYLDVLLAQDGGLHSELPRETRYSKEYEVYIQNLHDYLLSFLKRTQPLVDVDSKHREANVEFQKKWEAGELDADWEDHSNKRTASSEEAGGIWCCACQKGYSKQTVYDAHLTSKKHIKAIAKQAASSEPPQNPNGIQTPPTNPSNGASLWRSRLRNTALLTYLTNSLLVILAPTISDTKSNVERRFSLTAREREQELLEQSKPAATPTNNGDAAGEEEEEEERIYNPLKLPLGWDGKPIPYWLYKLHGLGVEYRCEICSDHVYMGRKNFDRHFQESRHAFGMRALGLPNTKHFHEITRIEDALTLAEKLKREGKHEIFEQETMEELEDDEGNVYNKKTYEDLKKQGLI